jgi:hypothetical protein
MVAIVGLEMAFVWWLLLATILGLDVLAWWLWLSRFLLVGI